MATISGMKDELHARLWAAQERWFALKECGATKHELKLQGLRERGDMFYCTRGLLFTETTGHCTRTRTRLPLGGAGARIISAFAGPSVPAGGKAREGRRG